ncbi:lipoyl(octanoyl) transferase LipB [Sphingomonas sp. MAH-20]|uniref:Octanoyltransferase n=2 Tax=Sphingomonadaceae TaxID=41297 RepID=A0A6I4IYW6_9SPHN|nr:MULTISPECIES: lipoyl(octanoyl) transferase LipB [Sphingomonas]MBA2918118.1 lipoyl(octanoyl) transferase LipB [Sphingomonas sp. CGMCC 1.13658]MVO77088.1 lipoyl(octanoyl) transferase LipB [Sphingomonas horti]
MIDDVEWRVSPGLTGYEAAVADMEARADAIRAGTAHERIWLLQHAPLYTAGTSADSSELIDPRFPVHKTGRGGRYTYHGPGQRVGYVQLDLDARGRDVRCYVHALEQWVIGALAALGVAARAVEGRVGIWVDTPGGEAKIGAIGVRVRRWVTLHGFSVNVDPDLDHFAGIVPCGLSEFPVASLASIGNNASLDALDSALRATFPGFLAALAKACGKKNS